MSRVRSTLVALSWFQSTCFLGGCGSSAPPAEALLIAADLRSQPWPSDTLLGTDGHLAVTFPDGGASLALLGQALSELDGFGTGTAVFFPVSAPVAVDPGATAKLVDLESDEPARLFPLFYRATSRQLVALPPPGTVLREHHRYACVVQSGVHDADGRPLRPSAAMAAALTGGPAAPPSYQQLAQQLGAGFEAATAFTTQTVSAWAPKVLADLSTVPPVATPTRSFHEGAELDDLFGGPVTTTRPGRPPSGGIRHDHVGLVVEGTFASPNYLAATPGQLGRFDASLTMKSMDAVPFMLILPKGSPANAPVAIFQHGINGDRSTMLAVADDYAARGYATLGIDSPWHGSRQPGAVDRVNNVSGAPIPDGIGDAVGLPVTTFFDFSGDAALGIAALDPRVMRDNLRQATVDLMQTVRLAKAGDWSSVPGVSLDGAAPIYTAASFGSILGANLMAVDPMVTAGVLDSAGGGLFVDLFGNSAVLSGVLSSLIGAAYDPGLDVSHPDTDPVRARQSLNLIETVLEAGDGLALSQAAAPDKSVLFLEAFNDEVVANQATEALAAAWGATQVTLAGSPPARVVALPQAPPGVSASPLRALVQLAPACHSMYTTQHDTRSFEDGAPPFVQRPVPLDVDNPIEQAHSLALDFMDSFRRGTPTVGVGGR